MFHKWMVCLSCDPSYAPHALCVVTSSRNPIPAFPSEGGGSSAQGIMPPWEHSPAAILACSSAFSFSLIRMSRKVLSSASYAMRCDAIRSAQAHSDRTDAMPMRVRVCVRGERAEGRGCHVSL